MMRTTLRRAIGLGAAGLLIVGAGSAAVLTGASAAAAAASSGYTWNNAQIDGGGFIPGIIFNRGAKDVAYARTDIGGAYRLDPSTKRWVPMLDSFGFDHWGYTGVLSIAADPVDTDKVYAAVGTYTNSWDPNNGAILRSADRGRSWQVSELPFKLGGNMPGRGMGERLAVDPDKNSVLYFGASGGNGLWRSTDSGVTWAKVSAFSNPGDYAEDPSDSTGLNGDKQGVVWVTFDDRGGTAGQASKVIYAGVADKQNPVYRSTDAGASWAPVPGAPTGFIPHKGELDDGTGDLFISTSDTAGPYTGAHGDVWRLDTTTDAWTRVSPIPSTDTSNNSFGYSGLSIDRQKPGTLMVTAYSSWWPDTQIFRSTDSGATWTRAWEFTSYPDRSLRYKLDVSASPWLTFGANPSPPEVTPKLGWMTEALSIDPFNSDRMFYGTGATLYGTDNLTDWDSGGTIDLGVRSQGIEETSVQDLISPPTGAPLLSALLDLGGFRHTDLTKVPSLMFTSPNYTSTTSLDYAEGEPNTIVRAGTIDRGSNPNVNRLAFSTDDGVTWFQASAEPPGVSGGGTVAAAADGSRFVWSPDGGQPSYTVGFGNSWSTAAGLPQGAVVESDRVDAKTFYGFSGGRFYVSTDGGATFTASMATGLPSGGQVRFKALPGHAGDIWLAGGQSGSYGLWHSSDTGATFSRVSGVDEADTVGFGKAAPGQSYPAIYSSAKVAGVRGIFRSDDAGKSWLRINDDQHQWGATNQAITGDPRVYGRVYLGTNGRGVIYGDLTGTSTEPTSSPTQTPTQSPSPTPTESASATPTSPSPTSAPATVSPTTVPATAMPPTTVAASTVPPVPSSVPATVSDLPVPPPTTSMAPPSSPAVPPVSTPGSCSVRYTVSGEWPSGFLGEVQITNTGSQPVDGWKLAWTFPDGQQVSQIWGADAVGVGTGATATNAGWDALIAAKSTVSVGFIGTWTSQNREPSGFTLNGAPCEVL